MRDSRRMREIAVLAVSAAIGAVLIDNYVKPVLKQKMGVK